MKWQHTLLILFLTHPAYAQTPLTLMTAQDANASSTSNLAIINHTTQNVQVSGLYIASYDINDCSACFGMVVAGNNALGAMVGPIRFQANQTIPIGKNYLYNLIYNGLYGVQQTMGTPPCKLPGCSWPGDDPSVHGWCINIGVMSLNSNYTYSNYQSGQNPPAAVVPYGQSVTSQPYQYKYDLIDPQTLGAGSACLGLIRCNDKTLTCSVDTPQSVAFQAY